MIILGRLAILAGALGAAGAPAQESPPAVDFAQDVLPLLREHCFSCHGEKKQKGGLRLDLREAALRGGVSGRAILPGKARESLLYQLLTSPDEEERMPQKAAPLAPSAVETVRRWIDSGAPWPDSQAGKGAGRHWAYEKPLRPEPPAVKDQSWVRNPIDAFVLAALEGKGLRPRREAPRHLLLRRLWLDLVGVPPAPEELRAFLDDPSEGAYERAVERLLADPRHGERWGRHWMDVWRYMDWAGWRAEVRDSQPHIWRWRDWIIESLNADKGYDRMVLEMLAGDELAPEDPETLRATGFLVRNWKRYSRESWLQETVEHTAKAFLATTMNCARCHHHFFDPITQEEYYRFRAFFEPHQVRLDHVPGQPDTAADGVARAYDAQLDAPTHLHVRGNEQNPDKSRSIPPGVPRALGGSPLRIEPVSLPRSAVAPERRDFVVRDLLAASGKEPAAARAKVDESLQKIARLEAAAAAERPAPELEKARAELQAALEELPLLLMAVPLAEAKHAALEALVAAERLEEAGKKGSEEWKKAAEAAAAAQRRHAALEAGRAHFAAQRAVLKAKDPAEARKKLAEAQKALAKAEADEKAPATAAYTPRKAAAYPAASTGRRLALARWIADPENPLTARVAANHVWMRHFGRPLVGTVFDFGSHGKAPTHPALLDWLATELVREKWSLKALHRLVVSSSAYRMDSAADPAALAADPENDLLWRMNPRRMEAELVRDGVLHVAGRLDPARGGPELPYAKLLETPRRSLYFQHAAEKQAAFLLLFDAANVNECYERSESIVPQQALALANSPLVLEASRLLAASLTKGAPAPDAFVAAAFERVLGRAPTAAERSECAAFLEVQARLLADPARLRAFTGGAPVSVAPSADPAQRAREDLVGVLFNHHDFVTIR
jgi:hypothetical protein